MPILESPEIEDLCKSYLDLISALYKLFNDYSDRLLGPAWDTATNFVINSISRVVGTYKDSIYADAAKGFHEESAVFIHIVVLMLPPLGYWFVLLSHPIMRKKPEEKNRIRDFMRSRQGFYILFVVTLLIMLSFSISQLRVSYINKVVTFSVQSMNILAPKIPDVEMKTLRANYYQVETRDDYLAFHKQLLELAKEAEVKLPKFKPL